MSKVNKAIETTISEVKKYATQPYGARLYRDWETDRKSTRLNSSH